MPSIDLRTGRIYDDTFCPPGVTIPIPEGITILPWMNFLNEGLAHNLLRMLKDYGLRSFHDALGSQLKNPYGTISTQPGIHYIIGRKKVGPGKYAIILSSDRAIPDGDGEVVWHTDFPVRLRNWVTTHTFCLSKIDYPEHKISEYLAGEFRGDVRSFQDITALLDSFMDPEVKNEYPIIPVMDHKGVTRKTDTVTQGGEFVQYASSVRVSLHPVTTDTARITSVVDNEPAKSFTPEDFRVTPLIASQGLASGVHPAFTRPMRPAPTADRFQVTQDLKMAQTPEAKDRFRRLQRAIRVAFPDKVSVIADSRPFTEIKMTAAITRGPGLRKIVFTDQMVKTAYVLNLTLFVRNLHDDALDEGLDARFLQELADLAASNP